ncbi:MAG TPA: LamG-like jellyroll fold domain-containing protein [Solirubrobacterales bacterium]|nr:LamG-like jellyroll fold domain-containing protein [Solirubrobacterales bacterium]
MREIHRGLLAFAFMTLAISVLFGVSASVAFASATPIAAYSFDEGEGETAEDLTGDGHTATIEGASWSTHGRYGGAMEFDASEEDVLKVPDSPELDFSEEFTLEAWVHPSGEESSWAPIIAKQQGGGKGAHRYAYWLHESWEGANYPAGGFETSTEGQDREAIAPEHLSENHWTHLAISFDGAKLRLYVDGELVKDASTTGMAQLTEGELQIGGSTEHGDFFNGRIDEVRIYNRALGGKEVRPDITPPTIPDGFDAIIEDEEEEVTYVSWDRSIDLPFADGTPGSGIQNYLYQYRLSPGEWSSWQSAPVPGFAIPATQSEEQIEVRVIARDNAGNVSPLRFAKLKSSPPVLTPEDLGSTKGGHGPVNIYPEPEENEKEGSGTGMSPKSSPSLLLSGDEEKLCAGEGENPCGRYHSIDAAEYAQRWVLDGQSDDEAEKNHNQAFRYFGGQGGDCTNFVSQALHAGGLKFMRANGINNPNAAFNPEENRTSLFEHGQGAWWSYYFEPYISTDFRQYDFTRGWAGAYGLYEHLVEYNLGHFLFANQTIHRGDVLFYSEGPNLKPEEIRHSQIVSRVTTGKDRTIWVAQHSDNYEEPLPYVINRLRKKEHQVLGRDYEIIYFRPVYAAANIG